MIRWRPLFPGLSALYENDFGNATLKRHHEVAQALRSTVTPLLYELAAASKVQPHSQRKPLPSTTLSPQDPHP